MGCRAMDNLQSITRINSINIQKKAICQLLVVLHKDLLQLSVEELIAVVQLFQAVARDNELNLFLIMLKSESKGKKLEGETGNKISSTLMLLGMLLEAAVVAICKTQEFLRSETVEDGNREVISNMFSLLHHNNNINSRSSVPHRQVKLLNHQHSELICLLKSTSNLMGTQAVIIQSAPVSVIIITGTNPPLKLLIIQ